MEKRWAKLDISITVKLRIQAHERCPLQQPNGRNKELLYPLTAASCQRLTLGRQYSARLAALVCNDSRRERCTAEVERWWQEYAVSDGKVEVEGNLRLRRMRADG